MPLYFFHIRDGWEIIPDEEGMVFADQELARAEGYASVRDLAAAALSNGQNLAAYAVEVTDEAGTVLHRIKVEMLYSEAS